MSCVKGLVESGQLTSVPPQYIFRTNPDQDHLTVTEPEAIPTIDLSLLTAGTPDQRSKVSQDLHHACQDWGFFMVINHGIPATLQEKMISAIESFFQLAEEEKREYSGKELFDPIRWGTSFNLEADKLLLWRDYLKIHVHPNFHAPANPSGFREILHEYCVRTRQVASEFLKGISKSLGLEENYINKKMEVGSVSHQLFVANLYPPCPQPELAMGLPPHSDHGLLTLLMQNELKGLQIRHDGKWVAVDPLPDAFLVNIGDHMEILTNGKYKSVVHRAVVNGKATRISVGTAHGPPLDSVVSPAPELVAREGQLPAYHGITYKEYLMIQQKNQLNGKSCLDHLRL
ncbi:hypothetical protein SLE2022_325770 [Rubroshorea leprosula]